MYEPIGRCHICKEEYTSTHVEIRPRVVVYTCSECLKKAKDYFIWICINCGQVYFRPKRVIIERLKNTGIGNAIRLCEGMQLIFGIDMCIECNPEGIVEYVYGSDHVMEVEACGS